MQLWQDADIIQGRGLGIKAMENLKDFLLMLGCDADAVIFDVINCARVFHHARDFDESGPAGVEIFQRIIEKVGENLVELRGIAEAIGQFGHAQSCAAGFHADC